MFILYNFSLNVVSVAIGFLQNLAITYFLNYYAFCKISGFSLTYFNFLPDLLFEINIFKMKNHHHRASVCQLLFYIWVPYK